LSTGIFPNSSKAGKLVYTEKLLATTLADGKRIAAAAKCKGGPGWVCAGHNLGKRHQTARAAIDGGAIGQALIGIAAVGMETWHPNPTFFYQRGGGPVFDLGPYYISALVTLLGPIIRVSAIGQKAPERKWRKFFGCWLEKRLKTV
jgi:predicted dehydrogenase